MTDFLSKIKSIPSETKKWYTSIREQIAFNDESESLAKLFQDRIFNPKKNDWQWVWIRGYSLMFITDYANEWSYLQKIENSTDHKSLLELLDLYFVTRYNFYNRKREGGSRHVLVILNKHILLVERLLDKALRKYSSFGVVNFSDSDEERPIYASLEAEQIYNNNWCFASLESIKGLEKIMRIKFYDLVLCCDIYLDKGKWVASQSILGYLISYMNSEGLLSISLNDYSYEEVATLFTTPLKIESTGKQAFQQVTRNLLKEVPDELLNEFRAQFNRLK